MDEREYTSGIILYRVKENLKEKGECLDELAAKPRLNVLGAVL